MTDNAAQHFLESAIAEFRQLKRLSERAMAQLDDAQFFAQLDAESNSVAILVKHVAGNLRSRWTDFLTSDGEKPDRNRDDEFVLDSAATREALMQAWERNWQVLFDALEPLRPEDAMRQVVIRHEPHTVIQAIHRQMLHYAQHVGQIIFLAKHLKAGDWKTLSVPRGQSEQFKQKMIEKMKRRAEGEPLVYHEMIQREDQTR
jgi:hypothetical protein